MNCLDFRRMLLSDPYSRDPAFVQHRRSCAECGAAAERADVFERKLKKALEVSVPPGLADGILLGQTTVSRRRGARLRRNWLFAMAASVVIGVGLVAALVPRPGQAAIQEFLVEHIEHEPRALLITEPVPAGQVAAIFASYGITLDTPIEGVTFAAPCEMYRGRGAHLVLQNEEGPVSVLYMPEVDIQKAFSMERDGLRGIVMPVEHGTLALLTTDVQPLEPVESHVRRALNIGL